MRLCLMLLPPCACHSQAPLCEQCLALCVASVPIPPLAHWPKTNPLINPVFLCLRHCPLCKAAAEVRDDSSDKNWLIVGYAKKGSNTLVLVDTGEDGLEE